MLSLGTYPHTEILMTPPCGFGIVYGQSYDALLVETMYKHEPLLPLVNRQLEGECKCLEASPLFLMRS